jgi:Fe-S oxidoreductase
MFVEDYRELKLADTEPIAKRCHLFEQFVEELLEREPEALRFNNAPGHVAIHAHCHAKSLVKTEFMARLAARLPGRTAALLDTGCCGMAGAFGALERKYDLSVKVAAPLVQQVTAQPPNTVVVASGTSCRHQLEHLTTVHPKHMAELLADAIS